MASEDYYNTGTASVANGSSTVTGIGTAWLGEINPGDRFWGASGQTVRITAVVSNTQLTLAHAWPGTTQSGNVYEIIYADEASAVGAASRRLLSLFSTGNIEALSNLESAANQIAYFTGEGEAALTGFTPAARSLLDDASTAAMRGTLGLPMQNGQPIVILASGQSNAAIYRSLDWSPPENLRLWNFDGFTQLTSVTGTAFTTVRDDAIAWAWSAAAKVAEAYPLSTVYLINVGTTGSLLHQWLPATPAADIYDCIERQMAAALPLTGRDTINAFLWWQGESDAVLPNRSYAKDFDTLHARLRGEDWFPHDTPVVLMGLSPFADDTVGRTEKLMKNMNETLRVTASMDPSRTFVRNTSPIALWDGVSPENHTHMKAAGYKMAGELAFAGLAGQDRAGSGRWVTVIRPQSKAIVSNAALASDDYLRFPMRTGKSYRVRGKLVGLAIDPAGIKYGFVAPARAAAFTLHRNNINQTAETIAASLLASHAITAAPTTSLIIEFDLVILAVSADGEFAVQWAQNTSDAAGIGIYAGSYLEFLEI